MHKIKLVRIDLKKNTYMEGEKTLIRGVDTKSYYLCKIGRQYIAGKFTIEWYGLCFGDWGESGLQYDPPGTNCSEWQAIWKIVPVR